MPVKKCQIQAVARYRAKNYETIAIDVKKGKREYYKAEAAKRGLSLASLIQTAVEKYIDDTASKSGSPT